MQPEVRDAVEREAREAGRDEDPMYWKRLYLAALDREEDRKREDKMNFLRWLTLAAIIVIAIVASLIDLWLK